MVSYSCKYCNFFTKIKTHYTRHEKTKKHGNNILKFKEKCEIMVMNTNEHKMNTNEHKRTQMNTNIPKKVYLENNIKCTYCNKQFKSVPSKRRHELHYCKENKSKNSVIIKELKKERKELFKQIEKLIDKVGDTTINNTQTNNIQINNYGKEDLSHITDKLKNSLLNAPYCAIPKMIEAVHFNNDKPENKNIALTNKKDKLIKVFTNNKWIYKDKTQTINDLMDGKYFILDSHYDNSSNSISKYEKFRKIYDEGDKIMIENLKKQCELVLLNNR